MIQVLVNNEAVYGLLERSGNLFTDFSIGKAIAFDLDNDFYVVVYSADTRNFCSFSAENCLQDLNAFPELLTFIQEYDASSIHSSLIEQAIKLTENRMHSKNNFRFFFDAH